MMSVSDSTRAYRGKISPFCIQINGGGQFADASGFIGNGATNTATVSGSGSKWTNSGALYVGYSGTGTLTVSSGGAVSANAALPLASVGVTNGWSLNPMQNILAVIL